jgi:glycosyltransferase involved in cell wall biosynthesis
VIDVSIVLPCYNAAAYIAASLHEIEAVMDHTGYRFELLFVEDQSRDDTRTILEDLIRARPDQRSLLVHDRNRGKGKSLSDGFAAARGRIVGYVDLDLQNPATILPVLIAAVADDGADVATARRIYRLGTSPYFWLRFFASKCYALLPRYIMQTGLKDVETGCKFFRREKIAPVLRMMTSEAWFWDTEIMVRAHHAGLVIHEIPTPFRKAPDASTVHLLRDTYRYLRDFTQFLPIERELRRSSERSR